MAESDTLAQRIDAEFMAVGDKIKDFQSEQLEQHKARQKRLEQLAKVFDRMPALWRSRLELLVKKFQDRVKVTPNILPSTRQARFDFQSNLARVSLKFTASTDRDVRKLVLGYDLEIIPVLMHYVPHAEIEFPLDDVDEKAAAKWIDDRIVDFVQTYLSLHQSDIYLKDSMVEDPVAHVRFPNMAAAATLAWQGKTFYFISDETRRDFAAQNKIPIT